MKFEDYIKTPYSIGDNVWVCDYRFNNDYISKPIRHVPPTKVMIDSNLNLPKINYSDIHFKVLGVNGIPNGHIIAPYDTLQVLLTKDEVFDYYTKKINESIKLVESKIQNHIDKYNQLMHKLRSYE
jgi:hypothetical protein